MVFVQLCFSVNRNHHKLFHMHPKYQDLSRWHLRCGWEQRSSCVPPGLYKYGNVLGLFFLCVAAGCCSSSSTFLSPDTFTSSTYLPYMHCHTCRWIMKECYDYGDLLFLKPVRLTPVGSQWWQHKVFSVILVLLPLLICR